MTDPSRLRIGLSIVAAGALRFVTVAYNFFLVPILLAAWGVEVYGEWIVLSALAAMASLSQVGFVQASASEMIMSISADEKDRAIKTLSTTIFSLAILVAVVMTVAILACFISDAGTHFGVKIITRGDAEAIVLLVLFSVLLGFFLGPVNAAVGTVKGAAVPWSVAAVVKMAELVGIILVAVAGRGPLAAAAVLVASAACSNLWALLLMRRNLPWLRISLGQLSKETFRRLLHPSLAQFLFYASVNIVAIQLLRIVLGHLAGAAAVATFATAVTFSRTARMLSGIFAQSLQVELSRAYAEGRTSFVVKSVETLCQVGFWLTLLMTAAMVAAAAPLFEIWTHGKIQADYLLVGMIGIGSIVGAYGEGFTYLLMGINRVWKIAIGHLLGSITAMILGALLFPRYGLYAMAAAFVLPEIGLAAVAHREVSRAFGTAGRGLFLSSIRPPVQIAREELLGTYSRIAGRLGGLRGWRD